LLLPDAQAPPGQQQLPPPLLLLLQPGCTLLPRPAATQQQQQQQALGFSLLSLNTCANACDLNRRAASKNAPAKNLAVLCRMRASYLMLCQAIDLAVRLLAAVYSMLLQCRSC
jgi:hypothetical protein